MFLYRLIGRRIKAFIIIIERPKRARSKTLEVYRKPSLTVVTNCRSNCLSVADAHLGHEHGGEPLPQGLPNAHSQLPIHSEAFDRRTGD